MAHLLGLLVCGLFLVVAVVGQQRPPINTCWDSQKVNDELQQCIQRSSGGNVGGSTGGGSSGGGWQPGGGRKPWPGQGNGNPAWYGQGGGNPGNGQGGNYGGYGGLDGSFQPTGPGSINNGGGSSYGGLNGGVQPGSGNSGGGSYSGGLNGGAQPGGSGMNGGWNYNRVHGQGSQGGSRYQPPYGPFRGQGGSNEQWAGAGGRYMRCYMELNRGISDINNLDLVKIRDNIGRLASVDKASDLMSAFDTCAQSYSVSTNVAKMRDYDQCMRNSMQTICYSNTGSGTGGVGPGMNPGAGLNNGVGPAAGP